VEKDKGIENDKDIVEYVFIYNDGETKLTKVTTGIQDNTFIQITEGLAEGDEVIVAPYRGCFQKTLKTMIK